jgi:hypothetical protein
MRRSVAALTTALILPVAACGGTDTEGDSVSTTPLSAQAPSGTMLCGFVPEESARTVLGTEEVSGAGDVRRDSTEALTRASCDVTAGGDDVESIRVRVGFLEGTIRPAFDEGLGNDSYEQLPADAGLGYSWTQEQGDATIGRSRLAHGDYLVEVDLLPAEGRDPSADAIALAQQVAAGLDLPDDWTLDGEPPTR